MSCGCCACLAGAGSAVEVFNRPGLTALRYRAGTWNTFYNSMIRRLTVPVDPPAPGDPATYSLHALTTREPDDPAIAMLDAWAVVGDVLTFYQERIANEAFLRTATERRSILEMGRLVGYTLKPGVSASVFLAYTLDDGARGIIPAGTKAQSVPGPGEQAQMFETSEDTDSRGAWNALLPRMSQPQEITLDTVLSLEKIWVSGTSIRLDKRDPLLFVFETKETNQPFYAIRRVSSTTIDTEHDRTEVALELIRPWYLNLQQAIVKQMAVLKSSQQTSGGSSGQTKKQPKAKKKKSSINTISASALHEMSSTPNAANPLAVLARLMQQVFLGVPRTTLQLYADGLANYPIVHEALADEHDPDPGTAPADGHAVSIAEIATPLLLERSVAPASQWQFSRSLQTSLNVRSDFMPRLLTTFYPRIETTLYAAMANINSQIPHTEFRSVHVLRRRASVFGYNAPTAFFEDRPTDDAKLPSLTWVPEDGTILHLDMPDDAVTTPSYLVAQHSGVNGGVTVTRVTASESVSHTAYTLSAKTTRLTLTEPWASGLAATPADSSKPKDTLVANLAIIRSATILTESEELSLAQQPIDRKIGKPADKGKAGSESQTRIEIDGVIDGLTPGRFVIVTGDRVDVKGTAGVAAAELAMIDNVEQHTDAGPGGTPFSVLTLAPKGLAYQYERDTVKILGNVVKATHGETRTEILGGGDASKALQTFTLRQTPLTYVSAPTVSGVKSTLAVRVNEVLWHETDSLIDAAPRDRKFITKTAHDGKVSVIFGNGRQGERLPTGSDNVRAQYRTGIGKQGNVAAGSISTAISRPLGVKSVVNPIESGGGADPEPRDDARRNIPVSFQALGRVVSVQDYADFARTFAGIAKARASMLSDGRRRVVHLTIGGAGDIEIDSTSDLYNNLVEALQKYGNRYQPLVVAMREKIVIAGAARVRVDPDYLWASVAPKVRAALLDTFSYDRRDFGQPVYPAEVVAAIQKVPGVAWVDLDALGGIKPDDLLPTPRPPAPHTPGTTATPPTPAPAHLGSPKISGVHPILPMPARHSHHALQPAQIAYLPPEVADLFILTEITNG